MVSPASSTKSILCSLGSVVASDCNTKQQQQQQQQDVGVALKDILAS
jgi:hypothetical protein